MTIEGTFHEIPRAASRQVLSSSYERNRKLSASMHSSRYSGIQYTSIFTRSRGYSKRVLCSRAKVIGDIHTCLRFRFLAVLNIERAGRVRPYVEERMFCNFEISLWYPAFLPATGIVVSIALIGWNILCRNWLTIGKWLSSIM